MASLDALMDEVRREVKGCPEFAIRYACQRTLREFCHETFFYQKTAIISLVANQASYELIPLEEEEVIQVVACEYDSRPVPAADPMDIPTTRRQTGSGVSNSICAYSFESPDWLTVYDTPAVDEEDALRVKVVVQPTLNNETVPDALDRAYRSQIASGVIGYLCGQTNVEWMDINKSILELRKYWSAIATAKGSRSVGLRTGSIMVRPRRFAI